MKTIANETIPTPGHDDLIVDNNPPADVFAVTLRKGAKETTLKRGTVLALSSGTAGDNTYVILGTEAKSGETLTANAILCEDVIVGIAKDENALAYRTGHFNRKALIINDAYAFEKNDEEALRAGGILLSDAI